jgi:hypothetical protein
MLVYQVLNYSFVMTGSRPYPIPNFLLINKLPIVQTLTTGYKFPWCEQVRTICEKEMRSHPGVATQTVTLSDVAWQGLPLSLGRLAVYRSNQ